VREDIIVRPAWYVPRVAAATFVVALAPVALVWELRAHGTISSPWACVAVAVALSLMASAAGSAYWRRRRGGDVLFSELLVWGWLWRRHVDHRFAHARELLGVAPGREGEAGAPLSAERRVQLLGQLAVALEAQDPYLNGHSRRVARHATSVARMLGLPREQVARIAAAAAIHDVGKLGMPAEVLNKPGRLTEAEYEIVRRHPVKGSELVAPLHDPELTAIVLHHHERIDGLGYPDGLAGEEIPLGARIVAVADTFDAVTSARPYRAASRHKEGLEVLERVAGTQLDPTVVRAFVRHYSGSRAVVAWATLTASPRRAMAWLVREVGGAPSIAAGKLAATAATTVAIGAAAASPPIVARDATRRRGPDAASAARAQAPGPPVATAARAHGAAYLATTRAAALRSRPHHGRAAPGGPLAAPSPSAAGVSQGSAGAPSATAPVASAGASSPAGAGSPSPHGTAPSGVAPVTAPAPHLTHNAVPGAASSSPTVGAPPAHATLPGAVLPSTTPQSGPLPHTTAPGDAGVAPVVTVSAPAPTTSGPSGAPLPAPAPASQDGSVIPPGGVGVRGDGSSSRHGGE
jgi:HD-GYP domain-containing protein (c-di-GMP phosphodiesterase class II)